ncbi:MAG: hypothetical protein MAG431_02000 [Chloroflexi bacterium]|nr:hypothetical protein [Chloroflexota bacterium]
MPAMTIFSAPKPFTDPHIDLIQRNAIQSWQRAGDDVEILLIGEEDGLAEVAEEYGVRHLPNVEKNEHGTPLVSSIFQLAREASDNELLVYVNADIILFPAFEETVQKMAKQVNRFLAVGRRMELEIRHELDFTPGWAESLKTETQSRGYLQRSVAIDYFIFPRNIFLQIPPFAIGRAGWDNWMIYHARQEKWLVIDLSPSVMVVHQNHNYGHLPENQIYHGLEESHANITLGGGPQNVYSIIDANRECRDGRVRRPRWSLIRLLRGVERLLIPQKTEGKRWYLSRRVRKIRVNLEKQQL